MALVQVSEGILEGEIVNNEYGGSYYSFKGIPYAEPPVGDLRFKAPLPPKQWEGVRSAKEFGSKCYQLNVFNKEIEGSEDCLYLNVYTPQIKPDKPLPVMFWIHGGTFRTGSGNDDLFGPQFLVRKGVIIVTINYRLAILGFLCLNTLAIPGNAGMKDQVEALKWVNNNIANFGGNPNNITIFGESAGGVSVSYHTISPLSKGLFKRAIAQSGASLSSWGLTDQPRERAIALAKRLGFDSEDDQELYDFFKKLPLESLIQTEAPIYISEKLNDPNIYFTIADERDIGGDERFFYGDMIDAVSNNVHEGIEIITGFTTDEGIAALGSKEAIEQKLELLKFYPQLFLNRPLEENILIRKQLEIGKKIKKYYFKDQITTGDWQILTKFLSMEIFVFDIIRWARICSKNNNKIYLYRFSCKSERNIISKMLGLGDVVGSTPVTSHGDDLMYLFVPKQLSSVVDCKSPTYKLIDRFTDLWTNFAKYGNPTPDECLGLKWKPYTIEKQDFLEIGNELLAGTAPYDEETQFWENIYKECGLFTI